MFHFNYSSFLVCGSRLSAWNIATLVFPTMSWSTKERAFCMKICFANNSYKLVQASFQSKFQCHHAPSKTRNFDWIQKFKEYGTMQNLNSKGVRDAFLVRWWVLGCKETRENWTFCTTSASLPPTSWRPFGAYFENITFMQSGFNEWNFGEWLYIDYSLKPAKCCLLDLYRIWQNFYGFCFFWVTVTVIIGFLLSGRQNS